jgi:hypothetical protein
MKMSEKRRSAMYRAIHNAIVDVRIAMKLPAKDDVVLAQVENEIWQEQKKVLGLK